MGKKIFLYIGITIVILGLVIFTFFPNMIYAIKAIGKTGNAFASDSGDDICSPPAGTSEEEWKEHMSHHPNIYKECLN